MRRRPWRLVVSHTRARESRIAAEALVKALREGGAQARAELVGAADLLRRVRRHQFDIAVLGLALSPGSNLSAYVHSAASQNFGAYRSTAVDRWLKLMAERPAMRERREMGRALHRELYADPPMLVFYSPSELAVLRRPLHVRTQSERWPPLSEFVVSDVGD